MRIQSIAVLAGAAIAGLVIYYLAFLALRPLARRTRTDVDDLLLKYLRRPARSLLPLIMIGLFLASVTAPPGLMSILGQIHGLAIIASVAWLLEFLQREYPDGLPRVRAEVREAPPENRSRERGMGVREE